MVNNVRDNGRDFYLLADHMTKLQNYKGGNRDFSAFRYSLHLILEQALHNLIVCLMISQKNYIKNSTNELACHSGY